MNNLFHEFPSVNAEEWKAKIVKDLKGKELSVLNFHDPIEEIDYRAFYHREDRKHSRLKPGSFPSTRGSKTQNNDWKNGAWIEIKNDKEANKQALELLMNGADLLLFDARDTGINWSNVLQGIELEYIKTQFKVSGTEEVMKILEIAGNAKNEISFCFDALSYKPDNELVKLRKESQSATYLVNGFGIQQCGGNTWQEIAFCLASGHEMLVTLIDNGFTIDEAAAQIHFHVGIGSNYFNEIAKLRALRSLWSKVVKAYVPEHDCSYNCQLTAIIGHTNKSLRDPYTNLLRQTTEVMAAASSADAVITLPYDLYSLDGASALASRMALNISLLLKEESYMHHVVDAVGGSYSVEALTETIGKKAWKEFQNIEKMGGIGNEAVLKEFCEGVEKKSRVRSEAVLSGSSTLIGINKYPDHEKKNAQWNEVPGYLGMKAFVADLIEKKETV